MYALLYACIAVSFYMPVLDNTTQMNANDMSCARVAAWKHTPHGALCTSLPNYSLRDNVYDVRRLPPEQLANEHFPPPDGESFDALNVELQRHVDLLLQEMGDDEDFPLLASLRDNVHLRTPLPFISTAPNSPPLFYVTTPVTVTSASTPLECEPLLHGTALAALPETIVAKAAEIAQPLYWTYGARRGRTLYVKYVPVGMQPREIRSLFTQFGEVHCIRVVAPHKYQVRDPRKAFSVCFIEYASCAEADVAGHCLQGMPLAVQHCLFVDRSMVGIKSAVADDYDPITRRPCTYGMSVASREYLARGHEHCCG